MGMSVVEQNAYDYDAWNGRLLIWETPEPREQYALGVDPAEGVGLDRSVCQVIKLGTLTHPDVQVAEFACDYLDPIDFASVVNTIGRFYGDSEMEAFATIEVNAPCGDTMIMDLRHKLDYTNLFVWKAYDRVNNIYTNKYGYWTNRTTRPKLIARGLHALMNKDLVINSEFLLDEMSDFQQDHFMAKAEARRGRHDDRLMAMLIGYMGAHDEEWAAGEDIAEQRRLYGMAKEVIKTSESVSGRKADYQSRPMSAKAMYEAADSALMEGWSDD
jgi:hypothetical protein